MGAGAALLGVSVLPYQAQGAINRFGADRVVLTGLVSDPTLAAPLGDWILYLYFSVYEDGTGFGIVADPVHPVANSHVAIQESVRNGNQYQFLGEVVRANDLALLGVKVVVQAVVHDDTTSVLEVMLNDAQFSGQGLVGGPPARR